MDWENLEADHAQKDEGRDDCAGQKVHPEKQLHGKLMAHSFPTGKCTGPRQHAGDGVTVADEVRPECTEEQG